MRVKYPRTFHFPWSPGRSSDDKVHSQEAVEAMFAGREVVVTEKLDGENTTLYPDGTSHARSLDSKGHPSRAWVRALAAEVGFNIPEGWRVCGENVFAEHSLGYDALPTWFLVFAIYDEHNRCLPWDETVEWAALLDLEVVPVLYRGPWSEEAVRSAFDGSSTFGSEGEGYVCRVADGFYYDEFSSSVAKYVRAGHVQTDQHWLYKTMVTNKLEG